MTSWRKKQRLLRQMGVKVSGRWGHDWSRRSLLKGLVALPVWDASGASSAPARAYVGAYGSNQQSGGIYLFEMNPRNGSLEQRKVVGDNGGPSWLAMDASHRFLYSANETARLGAGLSGSISAYSIDRTSGDLKLIDTSSSGGSGPVYLSLHPSEKFLFVANYGSGSVAVLRIDQNGKLGGITDVKHDTGTPGNARAASAPTGSFAVSGHDRPHAHMIAPDPSGRFVLGTDLALDRLYVWRFRANTGTLAENDPPFVTFPSGDGPRHFQFHPNGRWLYSIQEEGSTVAVFDYDGRLGRLMLKQTLATLPAGFAGTSFASELLLSKDGRFLYAGNRLRDSIACFAVGKDGKLRWVRETWTGGDYPRHMSFDSAGRFLFCCNQRGDAITSFRVRTKTGGLVSTGAYTPVPAPAMILFAPT